MPFDAAIKKQTIEEFATHEGDTGSPEVQVAVLSALRGRLDRFAAPPARTTHNRIPDNHPLNRIPHALDTERFGPR